MRFFAPYDMTEVVEQSHVSCVLHTFSQFQLNATLAENQPFEHELHQLVGLIASHNNGSDIILETSLTRSHTLEIPGISLSESLGTLAISPHGPPTKLFHLEGLRLSKQQERVDFDQQRPVFANGRTRSRNFRR